jgi:hypothetical protein
MVRLPISGLSSTPSTAGSGFEPAMRRHVRNTLPGAGVPIQCRRCKDAHCRQFQYWHVFSRLPVKTKSRLACRIIGFVCVFLLWEALNTETGHKNAFKYSFKRNQFRDFMTV